MDAIGCNRTVINAIREGGGNYALPVKENQKKLWAAIHEETEKIIKEERLDELDCAQKIQKGHGRIEKIVFRMLSDTGFLHEKLGLKSFYGTIARIGIMDKTTIRKANENIFDGK